MKRAAYFIQIIIFLKQQVRTEQEGALNNSFFPVQSRLRLLELRNQLPSL